LGFRIAEHRQARIDADAAIRLLNRHVPGDLANLWVQ
jgi:hypothetical protein